MTYPSWYDKDKRECKICGFLLQNNPILLKSHEKESFHLLKKMELDNNARQ